MIFDYLDNCSRYTSLGSGFLQAFEFLKRLDHTRPDGRCEIDGEAIYANLMSYETKRPVDLTHESHRRYADVQFLISGGESMYFSPATTPWQGNGYNAEKDYELCDLPGPPVTLRVEAGQFVIFFPGEAHKPNLALDVPAPVRKIVVKVRL